MNVEIVIIILLTLIAAGYLFAYIIKNRHYRVIDELEQKKKETSQLSLNEEFQKGSQLRLSGQSENEYKKLVKMWSEVEARQLPTIENYLFEAEKSADLFRFSKAKEAEKKAEETLESVRNSIQHIKHELEELSQHQAKNQQHVEETERRYAELRKKLLTQSFTFGPALEELENRLSELEGQFSIFSEKTQAGDHIEAKLTLEKLEGKISSMEAYLEIVPEELEVLDNVFPGELEELKAGYQELHEKGIKFPDDTITEELDRLDQEILLTKELIEELRLEEAGDRIENIDDQINGLYEKMENEIQAKQQVRKDMVELRRGFHYSMEQNRRLRIETDRINQSYVLDNDTLTAGEKYQTELKEKQKTFEHLEEDVMDFPMVFSDVRRQFEELFDELETINDEQEDLFEELLNLRAKELQIKQHIDVMEDRMRTIKRKVEMEHLPGLPEQYLDLFFYATDRIEELTNELGQIRMNMDKAVELEELCEEEVQKLEQQTNEMIESIHLTELTTQFISRYRSEHPSVESSIQESRRYFREEHEYDKALNILAAELEKIEPGAYESIRSQYYEETGNT